MFCPNNRSDPFVFAVVKSASNMKLFISGTSIPFGTFIPFGTCSISTFIELTSSWGSFLISLSTALLIKLPSIKLCVGGFCWGGLWFNGLCVCRGSSWEFSMWFNGFCGFICCVVREFCSGFCVGREFCKEFCVKEFCKEEF